MDDWDALDSAEPILSPTDKFKFTPKPLILVERMKVRRPMLGSPPPSSEPYTATPQDPKLGKDTVEFLDRQTSAIVTHSTSRDQTTPEIVSRRGPRLTNKLQTHHTSRNDTVASCRGTSGTSRVGRISSIVSSDVSTSSTDTFVDNSPSCTKWSSSVQILTDILPDFEMPNVRVDKPRKSFLDSVTSVLSRRTCRLFNMSFGPAITSTPLASRQSRTNDESSSMSFTFSSVSPNQTSGLTDSAMFPSNAVPDSYVVNPRRSIGPLWQTDSSSRTSTTTTAIPYKEPRSDTSAGILANAPEAIIYRSRRSLTRVNTPTLVLDGVFAIPRVSSSRKSTHGVVSTRKLPPRLRLSLSDVSNTTRIAPTPVSKISRAALRPGSDSPRSRLARVLTTSINQNVDASRKLKIQRTLEQYVPPLATRVKASIDPATQNEPETSRARRQVAVAGDIPEVRIGRVARLREMWEREL